ncbi:cache domain protein [mine drainage metagenome]|uniref:Cache domain protein n=1 Tax=mine drainage metagenome TaxID=410659 RepID=A0A1J5PQ88_9ZZZZ
MRWFSLMKRVLGTCAMGLLMAGPVQAAVQGSAAEAETMVNKAVAYIKANGQEKAAEEFTNGKLFKDRDLYVSYYTLDGTVIAHGANPKLVGKDLSALKDPDGKLFIQMISDLAKTKGKGWTGSYKFRNPVTNKVSEKIIYVERVDNTWVGVGVYK